MAVSTAVNDQITDAVSQSNVKVIGESPAVAIASQMLSLSHAHAMMAYNAVSHQHHSHIVSLSSVTDRVLLGGDEAMSGISSKISSMEQSMNKQFKTLEAMMSRLKSSPYGS